MVNSSNNNEESKYMTVDREIYKEVDDFSAEVLDGDELLKYVEARRGFFNNPEKTIEKYFVPEEIEDGLSTYGDLYYHYMSKYSKGYLYKIGDTGYTEGFRQLLEKYELDPDLLDINWESMKEKEEVYEVDLVDVLFAMVNYEIGKHGYTMFGINMGFESLLYFIVREDAYEKRIKKSYNLFTLFDLEFLENIYNEIYEVTGDLGIAKVRIGDFLEKKENGFHTMFKSKDANTVVSDINENNEKLMLIL